MATSNPGFTITRAGGVGRNIAENLARLGVATEFVSAFGADMNGNWLRSETEAAGVSVRHSLVSRGATGSYSAVLDRGGELVVAVSAMEILDALTPQVVDSIEALISSCALLVLDCNLREETLVRAATVARDAGVAVLVDTVSVTKSVRGNAVLDAGVEVHTISPNVAELATLAACAGNQQADLADAAARLHERGARHVWIRRGEAGSLMSSRRNHETMVDEFAACDAVVVDVTGAGDAMLAGYAAALVTGLGERNAVAYGHAAAAMTVESEWTVSPEMRLATLTARVHACGKSAKGQRLVADEHNG